MNGCTRSWLVALTGLTTLALSTCGGGSRGAHVPPMVPARAAAVENPIEPTEESITTGAELFATNCSSCHGEDGAGDGIAASGINPPPADLRSAVIQRFTDGGLFYIISNGIKRTAMPGWAGTLNEDSRWHLVNFIRSLAG